MLLSPLTKCIKQLKIRMETYGGVFRQNELRTRTALIDPLLRTLGWDVSDPDHVLPEYQIGKKYVNYALLGHTGKPVAILETTALGELLSDVHRWQIINYALRDGVPYAGVCNGDLWELYPVSEQGPLFEDRILDVSVRRSPVHECAISLLCLWQPNIRSGGAVKTSRPNVHKPAASSLPDDGWISFAQFGYPVGKPRPFALRLWDGKVRPISSWSDVIVETAGLLYEDGILTEAHLPLAPPRSTRRYLINIQPKHPGGMSFGRFKQPKDTPLFIHVNRTAVQVLSASVWLLEKFGKNPNTDAHLHRFK